MAGILGIVTRGEALPVDGETARRALESLSHRGPDGLVEVMTPTAYLGNARFASVDSPPGEKPLTSAEGRYAIAFDGQIFNAHELRDELGAAWTFRTSSDAEVALAAYLGWGADCLPRLRGMFAFAVLDRETDRVFLARDRFGIKPLFFAHSEGVLAFASEPKGIRRLALFPLEPDPRHFNEYLIFGYVAGEETLQRGLSELRPGYFLAFDGHVTTSRYATPWDGIYALIDPDRPDEAAAGLEERLLEAVRLWTRGVEEGATLMSGGLDSPLMSKLTAAVVPRLATFSAVFPSSQDVDEQVAIERVAPAIGVPHVPVQLDDEWLEQDLLALFSHYDEPVLDANYLTIAALCTAIREHTDAKVVISGEGSDELFGGYERHRTVAEEYARTGDPDVLVYARNVVALPRLRLFSDDDSIHNGTRHEFVDEIVRTPAGREPLNAVLLLDQLTFLNAYNNRKDRVGMQHSLELRMPYLDHELVRYANSLPATLKVRGEWRKWLLRRVAERYLPRDAVWQSAKQMLALPVTHLFAGRLGDVFRETLGAGCHLAARYSVEGMHSLLDDHRPYDPDRDHSNTLWRLLTLELWLESLRETSIAGR